MSITVNRHHRLIADIGAPSLVLTECAVQECLMHTAQISISIFLFLLCGGTKVTYSGRKMEAPYILNQTFLDFV